MATRYARASYSEVYDLHTEVGKTTLLGIHTPVTDRWHQYLGGFLQQFKKFRYKGASVSFVPVATLPADPLNISYEAGEPGMDPRDLVNPIIHCGMRGQSLGNYLDEIFRLNISDRLTALDVVNVGSDSADIDTLEDIYYTALSSSGFKKSHVQTGFRRSGLHPMVYQMTTNRPFNFAGEWNLDLGVPDAFVSTIGVNRAGQSALGEVRTGQAGNSGSSPLYIDANFGQGSTAEKFDYAQFFTNKLTSLGWLDTIQRRNYYSTTEGDYAQSVLTGLPKVYMYFVMLPPAYKQEMYFRVVIRHFFEFKGFKTLVGPFSTDTFVNKPYDGEIDNLPAESTSVASVDVYNGDVSLLSDGAA